MNKIRVLLADDHSVVRAGVRHVLEKHTDIEVVGEAADGLEAVRQAKLLKPDVVLMDISMPNLNGLEAIRLIVEAVPASRIVVLTMHKKEAYVREVLAGGALGYVLKASPSEDMVQAVRAAARGDYFLSPAINHEVIATYVRSAGTGQASPEQTGALSGREQQILRLTVEGNSVKQAAEMLFLSPKTVERHRANIMKKLQLSSIVDMMKYAIKHRIVDPETWTE